MVSKSERECLQERYPDLPWRRIDAERHDVARSNDDELAAVTRIGSHCGAYASPRSWNSSRVLSSLVRPGR